MKYTVVVVVAVALVCLLQVSSACYCRGMGCGGCGGYDPCCCCCCPCYTCCPPAIATVVPSTPPVVTEPAGATASATISHSDKGGLLFELLELLLGGDHKTYLSAVCSAGGSKANATATSTDSASPLDILETVAPIATGVVPPATGAVPPATGALPATGDITSIGNNTVENTDSVLPVTLVTNLLTDTV